MKTAKSYIVVLVIIGLLLYFPTLFNGFVWDDEELIVNNSQIQSLENLPAFFSGSTFNSGGGPSLSGLYYKPLMTVSFALVHALFGLNPLFFHLVQVLIHITNAVLVYLILLYIFRSFAFPIALIFLIHPINSEAVVYIADYQEVLFFFFSALMFLLILKTKIPRKIFYASLLVLPALLSKETGIIFTTIIFVYLVLFQRAKIFPAISGLGVSLIIYSFLRFSVAKIFFNKHGLTEISTTSLSGRLINIPEIVTTYFKNFFWPQHLAINQQWIVRSIELLPLLFNIFLAVLLVVITWLIYKSYRQVFKLWLFFLIWFLVSLGFHLQIFPLDLTVSDRWFYLPSVGLLGLIFVVLGLRNFKNTTLFLIIAGLLFIRTFIREFDWRDGLTLYSHDIAFSKNAFDLENNLGVELFRAGRIAEAKSHFENSVNLSPKWWTNWNNLGAVYEREGDLPKAESYYRKSIDNGQYYLAYENYAGILIKQKKIAGAKDFLEKEALKRLPYNLRLQKMLLSISKS